MKTLFAIFFLLLLAQFCSAVSEPVTDASAIDATGSDYAFETDLEYSNAPVYVNLTCSDAEGCNATFYCVDTVNSCTPASAYSQPVPISALGSSYIKFRSKDVLGHWEEVKSKTVRIVSAAITDASAKDATGQTYTFGTSVCGPVNVTLGCTHILGCTQTYYCVDAGNSCDPTTLYSGVFNVSAAGTYYVRYYSNNSLGYLETVKNSTVDVSSTPITTASAKDASGRTYVFDSTLENAYAPVSVTLGCCDSDRCAATYYCTDTGNTCIPNRYYAGPVSISANGTTYLRYQSIDSAAQSHYEGVRSGKITIAASAGGGEEGTGGSGGTGGGTGGTGGGTGGTGGSGGTKAKAGLLDCTTDVLSVINATAGSTIAVIAMLMALIIAVLYMIGTGFSRVEFIVLAKDEAFHLGISLMVLLMFGTIMTVSCSMVQGAFEFAYSNVNVTDVDDSCRTDVGLGSTMQELAGCYMDMMKDDADELIDEYTEKDIDLQVEASAFVSYYGLGGGVTYGPKAYRRAWASFIDSVKTLFIIPAYVSIAAQDIFVEFFIGSSGGSGTSGPAVLTMLLPVAFVMRFLPPMRQMGNMLIAFSVGVYLIIPVFITLNGAMYAYTFTEDDCNKYSQMISDKILGDCDSGTNLLRVARLYPQAFLLPNITIVIFITFISAANKALRVLG